jgi:NitT/TauT family transport system ATP-binding protein
MENNQIQLDHIGMKFQTELSETTALENITFNVKTGEFVSIIGPSGCGKSTILNIISGLVNQTEGSYHVKGKIGYMLQKDYLFEWRTIFENCLIGPEVQRSNLKEAKEKVYLLLKSYGLYEFKDYYPKQLSGGMRQRAALIRTLATNPDIVLLDEAFSALDYQTRLAIVDEVWAILKQENKTALIVTHDISEAISMSNRIIVLTQRPSTIKTIHSLDFAELGNTPLENRQHDHFKHYFNKIWEELNVHVNS